MFRGRAPLHILGRNRIMANIITDKALKRIGFAKDENNSKLKEVFKNNLRLKEVHIDIYPSNPMLSSEEFMLLLRTSDNNIMISNDGSRLILKKNDKNETHIMNILFSNVLECFFNVEERYYEFVINIQNIYYKITILN